MKTVVVRGLAAMVLVAGVAGHAAAASAMAAPFGVVLPSCEAIAVASGGPWAVTWASPAEPASPAPASMVTFDIPSLAAADDDPTPQTTTRKRVVAFEYSEGYKKRAKIHKIASFATLPLFATEYWLGAYMYAFPDNITPSKQSAHRVVGISLGALFGVNTITGVWNLIEARKDPNNRGRRMFHGLTMLLADAGFALAGAMRPTHPINNVNDYYNQRQTHRAIAVTSMTVATISYLSMLFGSH